MAKNKVATPSGYALKDLSGWKMRDVRAFQQRIKDNDGDIQGTFEVVSELINGWPFDGDPKDIEAYDDLTPAQWTEVQEVALQHFSAIFRKQG